MAAASLIAFLMAPWLLPLGLPPQDSSLPACCRREGKHHCLKVAQPPSAQLQQDPEAYLRSADSPCPYKVLPARIAPVAADAVQAIGVHAGRTSSRTWFARSSGYVYDGRSLLHFKRGPPLLS
jgi:hypothetical protein